MKKGFTLAELMGVIAIIGIIATVVTITVDRSIKSSRASTCEAQERSIIEGAKAYLIDDATKLPVDGNYSELYINVLQSNGYIDKKLENPMSGVSYTSADEVIVISCNAKSYQYKVCYSDKNSSCSGSENDTCTYVKNHRVDVCNE